MQTLCASHMVTPALLLNVPPTPPTLPWALLCELGDHPDRRLFLHLLIPRFLATHPVVVLFACLSLMPYILMHDTDFEATRNTSENVTIDAVFMNLAGFAAGTATPPEVWVVIKSFTSGEVVKSCIDLRRCISLHFGML